MSNLISSTKEKETFPNCLASNNRTLQLYFASGWRIFYFKYSNQTRSTPLVSPLILVHIYICIIQAFTNKIRKKKYLSNKFMFFPTRNMGVIKWDSKQCLPSYCCCYYYYYYYLNLPIVEVIGTVSSFIVNGCTSS